MGKWCRMGFDVSLGKICLHKCFDSLLRTSKLGHFLVILFVFSICAVSAISKRVRKWCDSYKGGRFCIKQVHFWVDG